MIRYPEENRKTTWLTGARHGNTIRKILETKDRKTITNFIDVQKESDDKSAHGRWMKERGIKYNSHCVGMSDHHPELHKGIVLLRRNKPPMCNQKTNGMKKSLPNKNLLKCPFSEKTPEDMVHLMVRCPRWNDKHET